MADEQQSPADSSQADAQKKMALPDGVSTGHDLTGYAEERKKMEDGKETAKKYGEPTYQSFMTKIGSDGVFAQRVVADLMAGTDDAKSINPTALETCAPQEENITGKLDHTEPVAKKLAGTVAENIPPTNGVNTDTAPTAEDGQ